MILGILILTLILARWKPKVVAAESKDAERCRRSLERLRADSGRLFPIKTDDFLFISSLMVGLCSAVTL